MRITKYKLISQNPEEIEFEVTKVTETTTTVRNSTKTDENGNILSSREGASVEVKSEIKEGITAVSLPTKTPAIVEILETLDTEQRNAVSLVENQRSEPIKIKTNPGDRAPAIDINKALYPDEGKAKPVIIPKVGEITWA